MPLTRIILYLDAQIGTIMRTAPFQTLGVGSAKQLPDAKAALCGCQDPWRFGETLSLSFGLQVQRFFQASSGPLGGTEALLESTFEAQGDILGRTNVSAILINLKKHREYLSPSSFREINIWNFSLKPVDLSPIRR